MRRTMQYRGDLGEYHSLAEGGKIIGRFLARKDAVLDAAAPDLLAAIETLLPHVLHYASMPHAHSDAHKDAANAAAAIAKAAGG